MKSIIAVLTLMTISFMGFAQQEEEEENQGSVIQNLTPSKLIGKGQVDVKWFNNIFTSKRQIDANGDAQDIERINFFTSTLEGFFGVGDNKRVALGAILEFRSNTIGGRGVFDVFQFDGERGIARSGLTNIAPSIKWVPFKNVGNFSVQSSLFIPTFGSESEEGVFLDQDGFTWQNRFFFDTSIGGDKSWQLFFDLNTEYNFGKKAVTASNGDTIEGSFANNSIRFIPGAFVSYFPNSKFTVQALLQHFHLVAITDGNFEGDQTAAGAGVKYQISKALNIEGLYTNFFRGSEFTNTGQTFNIGLRFVK